MNIIDMSNRHFCRTVLFLLISMVNVEGWGQTTLLSESFGTTTGTYPPGWTSSNTTNGFEASATSVSSGYSGASGSVNARFRNTGTLTHTLTYANSLSTAGFTNITVLWAGRATATFVQPVVFEWSVDGTTWTNVGYTQVPSNATWAFVNGAVRVPLPPAANGLSNLRFRWSVTADGSGTYQLDDFSVQGTVVPSNAINTSPIAGSPFCITSATGASVNISFTSLGTYSSNTYTAQLSDATGSFATPVNIGALVSDLNAGVISATIPAGTISGDGYKVRVISSSPTVTGTDNGTGIIINLAAAGILTGNEIVCVGSNQTYTVSTVPATTSYTWTLPGGWTGTSTTNSIRAIAGLTGDLKVKAHNACGNSPEQYLPVTVRPVQSIPIAGAAVFITSNSFSANWNPVAGATGYYVDVYTHALNVNTVGWTFPASGINLTPDIFNTNNIGKAISTNTGPIVDVAGATTRAPSTSAWNAGSGTRYWQIDLNTTGFNNLELSSKQRSSATGPRDFKIQYRVGAGAWTDVPSGNIIVGDNFTAGVVANLPLPAACENVPALAIRYIMTSNNSVNGSTVAAGGTSQIDDVFVAGDTYTFIPGFGNVFTTGNSLDITGLIPSKSYYYVARSYNGNCTSSNSNEVTVTTIAPCTPTAVIAGFNPAMGPAGTRVTIKGIGFNAVSSVRFGNANASSFSVLNDSTIIAQVPLTAAYDHIRVTAGSCTTSSPGKFTLISNNGSCGITNGASLTELFISEVYNAGSGTLSYIEIFNPTTAAINLGTYALQLQTNGALGNSITDYSLSGTLNSGSTKILSVGSSPVSCGNFTAAWSFPAGTGMNGNDQVFLLKSGTAIDRVDNPNYGGGSEPGFSQVRRPGSTGPSMTYRVTDWSISTTEDCGNLGITPFFIPASAVDINTHPADVECTSTIQLTVAATSSTGNLSYGWRYNDPGTTNGWLPISSLSTVYTVTGATTNTLTIGGNTPELYGYQFYVEVGSTGPGQCLQSSQAVHYRPVSKPYYRSVGNGSWNIPATWQMSDAVAGPWTATCTYPVASNSKEVIIEHYVTLPIDIAIDKVTINNTGTLEISSAAKLLLMNGDPSADLIVLGTLYDRGSNGNGIDFEDNLGIVNDASWLLGTNGTVIKTNLSSATNYRDFYETGIANIPASANWIYRYEGTNIGFASSATNSAMFYPNLTMENSITGNLYSSVINTGNPNLSSFTMLGVNNPIIIKGNFNVGGPGPGSIHFININTHSPVSILGDLNVRLGNTLSIDGGGINIGKGFNVAGNIHCNGTLNTSTASGILQLSGNGGIQTIAGTGIIRLQDVTVSNNNSIISLEKNISIPGVLKFAPGSRLDLKSGDITLRSTASATASVAPVGAGASINYGTGRFIVERYYPADRAWRLVTAPLSATGNIFNSWQNNGIYTVGQGAFVTGKDPDAAVNGLDASFNNNASLKTFRDNFYINVGNTLTQLLSGNASNAANTGYFMFVRGDRNRSPDNTIIPNTNVTTLGSRGKLQTGTQTFTLSNSSGASRIFSLVGNPFASSVDYNLLTKTNLNIHRFYTWDPHINQVGAFVTMEDYSNPGVFTSGTVTSSQGNFIQSSQAFFVEMSGPNASIGFKETDKSNNYNAALFRPATAAEITTARIRTRLMVMDLNNHFELADANLAEYNDAFGNEVNIDDALKMTNINENLGFQRSGNILSVERRSVIQASDTLFFYLGKLSRRVYRLELNCENIDPFLYAFLEDKFEDSATPLKLDGTTVYDFNTGLAPASYAPDRFRIIFRKLPTSPLPVIFTNINARKIGLDISVEWKVETGTIMHRYEVEKSTDGVHFEKVYSTIASGYGLNNTIYQWLDLNPVPGNRYYRVRGIDPSGGTIYSKIVMAEVEMGLPGIQVYPNPVISGRIDLRFTNMPSGNYQARLYNGLGQLILNRRIHHAGGISINNLPLKNKLSNGHYHLEIIHPGKTKSILKVIR